MRTLPGDLLARRVVRLLVSYLHYFRFAGSPPPLSLFNSHDTIEFLWLPPLLAVQSLNTLQRDTEKYIQYIAYEDAKREKVMVIPALAN